MQTKSNNIIAALKTQKSVYDMTPTEARLMMSKIKVPNTDSFDLNIQVLDIPVENCPNVKIKLIGPKSTNNLPLCIWIHGGGWVYNSSQFYEPLLRQIAYTNNMIVAYVDYSLAPEFMYPTAHLQCFATVNYMVKNSKTLNINENDISLCGDSAGGNIVNAISIMAKENKYPFIKQQILICPVTDHKMDSLSYMEHEYNLWLPKSGMEMFWNTYVPKIKDRCTNLLSPLNAELDELKGLPKTLIITVEMDVLRDEGQEYAKKLTDAKVDCKLVHYFGALHVFFIINHLQSTDEVKNFWQLLMNTLKSHNNLKLE